MLRNDDLEWYDISLFQTPHCRNVFGSALQLYRTSFPIPMSKPLIWDTGVSYILTLFKNDFVDYVHTEIPVKYVTEVI